jgi:hypothetical protein
MRSTSRDGGAGMAASNGGKYRKKKNIYSKFDEEFSTSLMLAAGEKGRETMEPTAMPKIEVYQTLD